MVWGAAISAALGVATAGVRSTLTRMAVSKSLGRIPIAMKYSRRIAKYAAPVGAGIAFGDKAAKVTKWGGAGWNYITQDSRNAVQKPAKGTNSGKRSRGASYEYIYKY